MGARWFTGAVLDAEACDLLVASGARDALLAFAGRDGVAEEYRVQTRQLLGVIDRGHRAFVDERTKGQVDAAGASSAREVPREDAAVLLGVKPQRVSQMVDEQKLVARKLRGRLLIDRASLDREIARRRSAA